MYIKNYLIRKLFRRVIPIIILMVVSNGISQDNNEIKQIIEAIWNNKKQEFANDIENNLAVNKTLVLYNTQEYTMNLLVYAHNTKNYQLIDEIAGLYLAAYPHLISVTEKTVTKGDPPKPIYTSVFSSPKQIWKEIGAPNDGYESVLNSAQFLFALSRTMNYILLIPEAERNTLSNANIFISDYTPVILEHYNRWLTEDKSFQMERSGCENGTFNHKEFLERKLNKTFGNQVSFCNAVKTDDLMIVAGIAEMLTANVTNSSAVPLSGAVKSRFLDHLDLGTRLIENRFANNTTNLLDFSGNPVEGIIFEPNVWVDHADYQYVDDTSLSCPPSAAAPQNTSFDISHQRRFVHIFETLYSNRHITNQSYPDVELMQKLSNQFIYGVFNNDLEKPLFTNFSDGNNGWYRNYKTAPFDFSIAAVTGGYGFWSTYNKDFHILRDALWEMIKSDDPEIVSHVYDHYATRYSPTCQRLEHMPRDLHKPNAQTHSRDLLQFLPTFFPIDTSTDDLIISTDCSSESKIYKSESNNIIDRQVYTSTYWKASDMVLGDFDGDGDDELLTAFHSSSQGTSIYKSEDGEYPGGGPLSQSVYSSTDYEVSSMVTGDFDGDGDDELITALHSPQGTSIYKSEDGEHPGGGTLSQVVYTSAYWEVTDMTAGDFDGDGDDELLTAFHSSSQGTSIYKSEDGENPGGGGLSHGVYTSTYWDVVDMTTGDFDGDGDDELLTAFHHSSQEASIYKSEDGENPGGGGLSHGVYTSTYWAVVDMTTGDFDGDGDDELLTALHHPSDGTSIYKSEDGEYPGGGNNSIKVHTLMAGCSINTMVGGRLKYKDIEPTSNPSNLKASLKVEDLSDKIFVFPNPNKGSFHIKSSNEEIKRIEIYDLSGKRMPMKITEEKEFEKVIRIVNGYRGIFVVKALIGNKTYSSKVSIN